MCRCPSAVPCRRLLCRLRRQCVGLSSAAARLGCVCCSGGWGCLRPCAPCGRRTRGRSRSLIGKLCAAAQSLFCRLLAGLLSAVRPRARHRPRGGSPPPPCLVCHSRGYPRRNVDKSAGLTHAAALDNSLRSPAHVHTYIRPKKRITALYMTLCFFCPHTRDLKSRGERSPYRFDPGHRHQSSRLKPPYLYGLAVCLYASRRSCTAANGTAALNLTA